MRHRPTRLALAVAPLLAAAPLTAQTQNIQVCVVEAGSLRLLTAQYSPVSGDTTIAGRAFSEVHPSGAAQYSAGAAWFVNNEEIDYDGSEYGKYGLPRVLGNTEVLPVGEFRNVTIFAEAGNAHDTPEVIYIPVRPGCEFQPYQLVPEAGPAVAGGSVGRVGNNDAVSGNLTDSDPTASDDSFYDEYFYTARAGEQVTIDLEAEEFDAYLVLGRGVGDDFESIESNDDGPDVGTNSRLEYTFEEGGEYTIRANSLNEGETGYYVLSISSAATSAGSEPSETAIRSGQTLKGALASSDAALPDGSFYDHFVYRASAGERATITLEAEGFDAFLVVGRSPKGLFEEIDSNDDGPSMGTDSQLEITFPTAGDYILRANSLGSGETGPYAITIRPGR